MNDIINIIAGFFSAIISSMGMGGGGILLLYLTAFANVPQLQAQGMNLLYFIPIAVTSLIFHMKNKLVVWRAALPAAAFGLVGVFFGTRLAGLINARWLSKGFAIFLLILGIREIFFDKKEKEKEKEK